MNKGLSLLAVFACLVLVGGGCQKNIEPAPQAEPEPAPEVMEDVADVLPADYTGDLTINSELSNVTWEGSKVTGKHEGELNVKSGEVVFEQGMLGSGSFIMDMTSITVTDIENASMNQKLVEHLKNEDFFGVDIHPTSTFEITEVIETNKEAGEFNIAGRVTIKDIEQDITFPATITFDGDKVKAMAEITLDRTDFGIKYGSGKFFSDLGDKMIKDEFTLKMDLVATK